MQAAFHDDSARDDIGTEAFRRRAQGRTPILADELEKESQPPVLYHYTDDVGLKGILESGALWLTDIASLNDPSELDHGFSLAVDILNQRAAEGPPEVKEFARRFERFMADD